MLQAERCNKILERKEEAFINCQSISFALKTEQAYPEVPSLSRYGAVCGRERDKRETKDKEVG